MNVVDVCESYSPDGGGVRTYVHAKLDAAARLGVALTVVVPGTPAQVAARQDGPVRWVQSRRSPFDARYGLFNDARALHKVLDEIRPDVIEGSSPWNGGRFVASYPGRAAKSFVFHTDPVAVWPQTFFGRWVGFDRVDRWCGPWWRALRRLTCEYDTTVVSGEWLAARLRRHGIDRTSVIPFGIDKDAFSPRLRDEELRRELLRACGVPADGKLALAISRLDPEKQVTTIIEGVSRAGRARPVGLVIFGRGALQRWFAAKVSRTQHARLQGYTSDRRFLARALASADVFVHGSAAETYGLVVAEAICSGVPVVVPDRGGAAALADPRCARCYRPADAGACAEAILAVLDQDPASWAAGCEAKAREVGTLEQHFHALFGHYRALCGQSDAAVGQRRTA